MTTKADLEKTIGEKDTQIAELEKAIHNTQIAIQNMPPPMTLTLSISRANGRITMIHNAENESDVRLLIQALRTLEKQFNDSLMEIVETRIRQELENQNA